MNLFKTIMFGSVASILSFSTLAAPFTASVQNDAYVVAKGGVANGIATANYNNDNQPDLYYIANKLLGTSYTGNQDLDDRLLANDELFIGNGKHSVMLAGMAASNVNTLGYYTDLGVGNDRNELISNQSGFFEVSADGSFANPFNASIFEIYGQFGLYLSSKHHQSGQMFDYFSEASMNVGDGGLDHMMAFSLDELNGQSYWVNDGNGLTEYQYQNALLIGWEDLSINDPLYDDDYDDIMFVIDFRSASVPAPAPLALFGASLLAFGALRRRR